MKKAKLITHTITEKKEFKVHAKDIFKHIEDLENKGWIIVNYFRDMFGDQTTFTIKAEKIKVLK